MITSSLNGIKSLLQGAGNIYILGEASTGKECFEKIALEPPHVLILDISLPDTSGIEITRRITAEVPFGQSADIVDVHQRGFHHQCRESRGKRVFAEKHFPRRVAARHPDSQ